MSNNIYPLPAGELAVEYEIKAQQLILSAKGKSQPITSDIKFVRIPWMGGLKFELQGRVLAIMGEPQPYSAELTFKMPPPTVTDVIIVYAGDLSGKIVPVHCTSFLPPSDDGASPKLLKETTAESLKPPPTSTANNEHISVINGHIFKINCPSEVPRFGSIEMDFDNKYLQLQTAGIQDKDIVWTFEGLQPTPDTEVTLLISGGIAQYLIKKVYNVFIGLGGETAIEPGDNGYIPSFLQRVSEGRSIITSTYPDAQLFGALARAPFRLGVSNPEELSSITVTCKLNDSNLATVGTVGYSKLCPVEVTPGVLDDLQAVPSSIPMDAGKADSLIKAQGRTAPYISLSLDHSSLPVSTWNRATPLPWHLALLLIWCLFPLGFALV